MTLQISPIHDWHVDHGAKLAEFGGWSMPLEYAGGGVLAEHTAVRESVGLFDVSHLGKATVTGPGALAYLNTRLTNDTNKVGPGRAQYTLLCADDGGVVDDLIIYVRSADDVLLVPNAANTATVVAALADGAPDGLTITDRHTEHVVFAVQGPRSGEVLTAAGLPLVEDYMRFVTAELPVSTGAPITLTVCRTGYTGELGYELVAPSSAGLAVWQAVMDAGEPYAIRPAGLGARDTLRTEMGYPLHGQDIGPSITPVQARLGWAIGWKKPDFSGAEALRRERADGPQRLLRGLKAAGRGIPRPGMTVLDAAGAEIGVVTSGTFSPTLKTGVALALLDARVSDGDAVQVQVRARREPFTLTKPPFVTPGVRA